MYPLSVMMTALVYIAVTLGVYLYTKSLDTVAGRSEFMLLLGCFLFYVAYPLLHNDVKAIMGTILLTIVAAMLMMFLWTFVLIFDIWSTFR